MVWTRSETLALAQQSCCACYGLGLKPEADGDPTPCNCVLRAIFRLCYSKFQQCVSKDKHLSRASLEPNPARQRKSVWGLKNEEYIADFCLVARLALTDQEYQLFKYHFLLGADWVLCCGKLQIDRSTFFHQVYAIEQKLGRIFRELKPYGLFPIDEYFSSSPKGNPMQPFTVGTKRQNQQTKTRCWLKVPLKAA